MRVIKFFNVLLVAMTMSTFASAKLSKNDVHVKGAKLLPSKVSTRIYSYRDRGYKYTTLSKEKSARYHSVGIASYYGGKFNGRKTANGEIFNENNFTAAHKTLAFGTYLLVTNLRNGRKIIVRVNDRGPFSKKRILDLSKRAARSLGMLRSGIAKVKVEALQVDQNGYISGKGTSSLLKIAQKSGLSLKIKQAPILTAPVIVKIVNFKSKDTAYEITRKVKPKTVIEKNGKYYDVLIAVDNLLQAKKLKNQLALLTHNKVYIHNKK
ncbi:MULTISPECIES: septal ring lytic transglycosylase RlpA family protein [Pasteurellaceae]|uniref:Endolytic peptidoglycan transglycosylase RlpA n=1 Tax=Pasteurella atlantica TaxID=2827233 RepID=A0AAW8CKK0_9PAST|nr:septal ring lytic transglycosylase RlpA family protein [Pasteurella atlantica]MBR0572917.1 septal ring lytic transglycosylase RlpA family protein [Pasteurella atlantica]MDP8038956.1 septal ring lytic transglycosylase RlpA family protein [Pasteurella atlantica]MDP8040935.1 septal ring lytic transglycosylase RlpA family protein [Pasteurella atlantica]MDP8043071.1 septal ring lytic transglycosylase RlpA family protein [Pasteurella atlantica]MDP8045157.1 septal ring lytic transglycosylase RlpA 